MAGRRIPLHLAVHPWFQDHRFGGRTILAAVEAMQQLALIAQAEVPGIDVRDLTQARFARFLEIPPELRQIEAVVEWEGQEAGGVWFRLLTRVQGKTLARMVCHCELCFTGQPPGDARQRADGDAAEPQLTVSAAQIYRELVPFGPGYQSLEGQLLLTATGARGTVRAPLEATSPAAPLGSPFPLDGAMHAACVHGQRLVDFVPFPVGFEARRIYRPTRAGELYRVQVRLQSLTAEELVYDLLLVDQEDQIREQVTGLRMRDVSGGRMAPPAWIQEDR